MPRTLAAVLFAFAASWTGSGQTYTISTFAGGGLPVNIPGTSASLYNPQAVALDKAGNVYFTNGNDVLRLDAVTGILTLVAGSGTPGYSGDNGPATSARLNGPSGVAVDSAGNVYIADEGNNVIRKVSGGVIATVAGNGTQGRIGDNGPATSAELYSPYGVAVDSAGNLYIADTGNGMVRKVANGVITTVAGGGQLYPWGNPATSSGLGQPVALAVDSAGNLYIADQGYAAVLSVSNGVINFAAGGGAGGSCETGPATHGRLWSPSGVAVDSAGNMYVTDTGDSRVVEVSNGLLTTVAGICDTPGFSGDGGAATSAQMNQPWGVAVDSAGNLYIADPDTVRIRKVSNGAITTVAGNGTDALSGDGGPATSAQLGHPLAVAVDSAANLYIADQVSGTVRKVSKGVIATVAGNGTSSYSGVVSQADGSGFTGDGGPATSAQLWVPNGIAVDSVGNLYIADGESRVRKVSNGVITTVAGNGTAPDSGDGGPPTSARILDPSGIAVDSAGNLYISEWDGSRIRKVSGGVITTVAGTGVQGFNGDSGPATSAQLNRPWGVAVDSDGNLYIADSYNYRIRKVSNGAITTVAGNGTAGFSGDNGPATSAQLSGPFGVAVDSAGDLYITDGNRVRKVSNGVIATVAGNGTAGFSGDGGPAGSATFNAALDGVAVDSAGNVYIADTNNSRVRLLTPGTLPAIFPGGVVPIYGNVSVIQPGSWISIYGTNLANGTSLWNGDFPTSLGGTSVAIDGKLGYLWYAGPSQINLQAPDDTATGPVSVVVNTDWGTASSTVTLAAYGPSFCLLGDGKHVTGEIMTANGTGAYGGGTYDLAGPTGAFYFYTRPVQAGETLVLYGVGFGPTNPNASAGRPFSGVAPTTNPVTVTIGGVPANVGFSGIVEAGLYQINLTVPAGAGSGDQALVATVNGVKTPAGPVVTLQ